MIPIERITHAAWCNTRRLQSAPCSCDRTRLARAWPYALAALVSQAIVILALLAKVLA